jgi:1-acyl-sn-glycerol-3-phosphate acyltransferase
LIVGLVRLVALGVDTALFVPVVLVTSLLDRDAKLGYRIARYWALVNARVAGMRLHVEGLEHLDPHVSYVFMSNHRSHLDVLALVRALWPYQLRWVTKRELTRVPGFGWALLATRQIIIDRARHDQALASLEHAKERLGRGISVVFFPEGTRARGDAMLPFKKGGFVFALQTGTPIVPIAITGTAAIMPRSRWLIRHGGDVRVTIHPPIATAGRPLDDRDALLAAVRDVLAASIGRAGAAAPAAQVAARRGWPAGAPA